MSRPKRIAITMGDPAGIGPEIVLKALRELAPSVAAGNIEPIVVGSRQILAEAADRLEWDIERADYRPAAWPQVRVQEIRDSSGLILPGEVSAAAGALAYQAVRDAVTSALAGHVDAIATAPISKEALHLAGHPHAGHTELLRDLTGSRDVCMMLAHDRLRVTHICTHVPLAQVPARITPTRVGRVIELTETALRDLGIAMPRMAVCGLNPHAGESGLFGQEEAEILTPVIKEYRQRGLDIDGPLPGDTVFVKALAGQFDAVIAMYHDQGHIPVKLLGFSVDPQSGEWTSLSGVNVTLGLPIVRTSVDHGTAFNIAGKGVANAQSMVEAIEMAAQLVAARTKKARRDKT